MMDTDILFRDGRRFNSDFSDMPSLNPSDSVDSTSCDDQLETETFTSGICSWNYNTGLNNDFELILDRFDFDPIDDDFGSRVKEWENTVQKDVEITINEKPLLSELNAVKQELDFLVDQKPLLEDLDALKLETDNIINIVKTEPNTAHIDTHYNVEQMKKDIPELFEIASEPFFDVSGTPEDTASNSLLVNDLPPNLDLCSFINCDDITTLSDDMTTPIDDITTSSDDIGTPSDDITTVSDNIATPYENKFEDEITAYKETKIGNNIEVPKPKFKAGRKRIDLKAMRYIVDDEHEEEEEHIDVETISESGNNPVLEARDLDSLLQQFEASGVEVKDPTCKANLINDNAILSNKKPTPNLTKVVLNDQISLSKKNKRSQQKDNEQIKQVKVGALLDASAQLESASTSRQKVELELYAHKKTESNKQKLQSSVASNNKQIIEALPQELINRIKESGKRKRIAIIDPVPNNSIKKRKMQDSSVVIQSSTSSTGSIQNVATRQSVELDHNYCSVILFNKKNAKKDSGYISAEDEDKTLHNQPIVKNADGKLMISLLKVNTIRSNVHENKKKKLNIEEYKKRRQGILNTPSSSQSNSPMSSTCSSPLPEDENTKRLKHEEKMRKMALELLNTPPKSSSNITKLTTKPVRIPVRAIAQPPLDMDVITNISIGVNTDISGRNPLTQAAEKLEEIKPLLENASVKISSNSLINSLIENIPRVIKTNTEIKPKVVKEHGENKTVIYLPKNRKPPQCSHVAVQTSLSLLGDNKRRYRRRRDSSTSTSSSSCRVRSSNRSNQSQGSRCSKSSRSSRSTSISSSSSSSTCRSSTRSRSTSRSPSPQMNRRKFDYDREYIQEVEERRVVYVGKIAPKTSKQDLYRRFSRFGPIKTISLHFRNHGDNYGFVTFEHNLDAYKAIEHGNDDPYDIQYDLSFGGRRLFCKTTYSDLDNMRDDSGYGPFTSSGISSSGGSFDILLKEMQEKLRRRKV